MSWKCNRIIKSLSVYSTYICGPLDTCNYVGFFLLSMLPWINKSIVLKRFANIRCFYLMNICHCHSNTTVQHFGVQKVWFWWGTRYLWLNYLDLTACSFLNKVPVWKPEDFTSVTISWQQTFCLQLLERVEKRERAALTFTKLMADLNVFGSSRHWTTSAGGLLSIHTRV